MKPILLLALLCLCSSTLWSAPTVETLPLPGNSARDSDLVIDSSGHIHAVWLQDGTVFYAVSAGPGQNFSTPLQVSPANEGSTGGMFRGPQIALGRDESVHVIWYPDQSKLDQKNWGVRYARLSKGADKFSDVVNLAQMPSDNYSLATDGKGQVAVVWTAGGIFITTSSNDGQSFDSPQKLSGPDPCECCGTAPSFGPDGKLALVYRDKTNNDRNIYLVPDALKSPGQRTRLNSENWKINACPMTGSSLTLLPKGGFVAGWEEKGNVFISFSPDSTTQPRQILAGKGKYPRALGLPDGTAFVTWKQGENVLWKNFDSTGTELASGTTGVTESGDKFGAALAGNGHVLVSP